MSLLINGMDMPKNCDDCRLRSFNLLGGMMCCLVDENVTNQEFAYKRHPNCPLAEIPTPHGDLIDRNELCSKLFPVMNAQEGNAKTFMESVICLIKKRPSTIIEAEE